MLFRALGLVGALGLASAQNAKVPSISLCGLSTAESGLVATDSFRTLAAYPSANAGLFNSALVEGTCAAGQQPITSVGVGTIATACQANNIQPITLRIACTNPGTCPTTPQGVQDFCTSPTRVPASFQSTCASVVELLGGGGTYKIKGSTFYFGYQSTPIYSAVAGNRNVALAQTNVQCTYWPTTFTNTEGWPGQGTNRFNKCPVSTVQVQTTLATTPPANAFTIDNAGGNSVGLGTPVNFATSIVLTYKKPCASVAVM